MTDNDGQSVQANGFANTFSTADPACTTAGGHRVGAPAPSSEASEATAPGRSAQPSGTPPSRHFPSI
ncbi:MAG: hypothetical protein ACR2LJ_05520 [Acidimicrobiales bacterium]